MKKPPADLLHRIAPVLALVAVNAVAISGQAQWAYDQLGNNPWTAAAFAVTLESVSLFLTAEASRAMLADDRSGTLRLGAYGVALVVGCMNYVAHAGPGYAPTAMAIAFGLLSTLSPILWTIHTRGQHRAILRTRGLIDPRAVRFPLVLWAMYPAATFRAFRAAAWAGINDPGRARAFLAERSALAELADADAIRYALAALDTHDTHAGRVWLQQRGRTVAPAALAEVTAEARPALVRRVAELVPVSPAAGPAGSDYHRGQLGACQTKRDAARYAYGHLGTGASSGEVVRWLAEHGVDVSRSEAGAVGRELRTPAEAAELAEDQGVTEAAPPAGIPTARINGNRPTLAAVPSL